MTHAAYGSQCFCDDCRATRERAVTANARRGVRPLFSPPVVTPVSAVGDSTSGAAEPGEGVPVLASLMHGHAAASDTNLTEVPAC
mgnify:CR=1 FL=1